MTKSYNWGVPRLCGNHRLGTPSDTVKLARRTVDVFVPAGMASTRREPDDNFNSGMETEMVGDLADTTERMAMVTLTTQSAD